ncbi:MAG: spermidine synthase [Xanthobacteraceae bacterium]
MAAGENGSTGTTLARSPGLVLATYAAAIFLSAALLFAVQPLFAKMVLPRLGGSPSVWSVAMVFFQAVLLAGYAYAHVLTRHLSGRVAVVVHVALLVVATLALPLAIASGWGRPPARGETLWLLGLFAVSIGLPFFALSANGPLLQAWFARTGHPSAKDPYFLYAASNVGSFLALMSYPLLVEPFTHLPDQTRMWSVAFYLLIVLIAGCGVLLARSRNALPEVAAAEAGDEAPPTWRDAATWVGLAAVPAGLLIAVTAHVSTDVAASPMLWVIPLALYLATFVVVFQTRPVLPHRWVVLIEPAFIVLLVAVLVFSGLDQIFLVVAANIAAFFVIALTCHGELARRRPAARHLTAFYMWMSTGGMIGGIAAGLIAPHVFSTVAEYPILIVLAILCRPGVAVGQGARENLVWLGLVILALTVAVAGPVFGYTMEETKYKYVIATLLAVSALFWRDPLKFAAMIALAFVVIRLYGPDSSGRDYVRSFFGVHKIFETADGQFRVLQHGTTEHGAQRIRTPDGRPVTGRPEPLTYYHFASPIAQGIKGARERKQGPIRLAVIGLGSGSTACLTEPGDKLTYYEIDPAVIRIAKDANRFTFLKECAPDAEIVIGDARLTLADAEDGQYDVIVVDAFTSDAIPVHLMTREAMAVYVKKLSPHGIVLVHVSNRHMELASVVAGIADANGLVAWVNDKSSDEDEANYKYTSTVCAVARDEDDFPTDMAESDDWELEEPDDDQWVWTDDYSNVIGAMIRQLRK